VRALLTAHKGHIGAVERLRPVAEIRDFPRGVRDLAEGDLDTVPSGMAASAYTKSQDHIGAGLAPRRSATPFRDIIGGILSILDALRHPIHNECFHTDGSQASSAFLRALALGRRGSL
jgi:hypothetical protein